MKQCIRNGLVIDPESGLCEMRDVWIEDGRILSVTDQKALRKQYESKENVTYLNAFGKWVVPGLIDLHVHFREPGFEGKETIQSGTKAAAKGGFTTVCCMPNTRPPIDNRETVEMVDQKARQGAGVNVLSVGAITMEQKGIALSDLVGMQQADTICRELTGNGICAISDDGRTVMDAGLMRQAMEQAARNKIPVFSHAEEETMTGGSMNDGGSARRFGARGIPYEAEDIIVARDILLAKSTGCQLHFCHISTQGSVEMIRQAKAEGIPVTAETAPHYFTLDDSCLGLEQADGSFQLDTNKKMNPPLRTKQDRDTLRIALKDGIIDAIATDHAPHMPDEKSQPFDQAPFGVSGLETSFAVSYTELVKTGVLTPQQLIQRMSTGPAQVLGIQRGTISPGKVADITVIDIATQWQVRGDKFISKGKNTAFEGRKVFGEIVYTLVGGEVIYDRSTATEY